jgi:hypothetical protein
MVKSTTIAAMLKAMAIAMVMANNAIHMAQPPRWRKSAREVWPRNARGRFWFLGSLERMRIFGD